MEGCALTDLQQASYGYKNSNKKEAAYIREEGKGFRQYPILQGNFGKMEKGHGGSEERGQWPVML